MQRILGDLFASLAIMLERPFVLRDFLALDNYLGSVERIGLKTTRLRSLSGEQLIFANADLLGSRIRNYGRMQERRVVFTIRVPYSTPREKLESIPRILRQAVEGQDRTRFDRAHFSAFGDASLEFETVYYVLTADHGAYTDVQQAINLGIMDRFAAEGIEFTQPTRSVNGARDHVASAVTASPPA
jgi:small-conductance mechanosensitive channel